MSDLIDREDLKQKFAEEVENYYSSVQDIRMLSILEPVYKRFKMIILTAPTVETQSDIQCSEWIKSSPLTDTEQCAKCGYNIISEELRTPCCPGCGREMLNFEDTVEE